MREVSDAFIEQVSQALPAFPRDVIREWLGHAESEKWPPEIGPDGCPLGKWGRVLGRYKMALWQELKWQRASLELLFQRLHPESRAVVLQMAMAYNSPLGDPSLRLRVDEALQSIRETETIRSPVCVLARTQGYEILDGFHRITALFLADQLGIAGREKHEAWIAFGVDPDSQCFQCAQPAPIDPADDF